MYNEDSDEGDTHVRRPMPKPVQSLTQKPDPMKMNQLLDRISILIKKLGKSKMTCSQLYLMFKAEYNCYPDFASVGCTSFVELLSHLQDNNALTLEIDNELKDFVVLPPLQEKSASIHKSNEKLDSLLDHMNPNSSNENSIEKESNLSKNNDKQDSFEDHLNLKCSGEELVKITAIRSPNKLFIQPLTCLKELEDLQELLKLLMKSNDIDSIPFNIEIDGLYAVLVKEDLRRVKVLESDKTNHSVKLILIDLGISMEFPADCLRKIPHFISKIPPMCKAVSLGN